MAIEPTFIGTVQDVKGSSVSVLMSDNILSGFTFVKGQGYRLGQIGSFVRVPIGFIELFGIVSQVGASAVPESQQATHPFGNRWMTIQLVGEGYKSGSFQRGISQYPTIGDEVHLVSENDLRKIYGQPDRGYFVSIGTVSGADSIPALVDVNKLVTRHSAVVGTTGSGKSTTVASLLNALSDSKYPSARILVFDLHGEYGKALKDQANVYRINGNAANGEKELSVPFWALSFDELSDICFGKELEDKSRHFLMEKILEYKSKSVQKYPRDGVELDLLDVDSPIPYNIHKLWFDLFGQCFSTYYNQSGNDKNDISSWAFAEDERGNKLTGDYEKATPPKFKPVDTSASATVKINYTGILGSYANLGGLLETLGAKLRLPRYDFLFKPKDFAPELDGKVESDLDKLLLDWISSKKPITILDLSGVPSEITNSIVGAITRILYDALFWGRNYSQGGRQRPLLLVMEEAHNYLSNNSSNFASLAVQKVVKEGRKYGIGTMIVSQRPSEINSTILSQCGTFIALRLSNSADKGHISSVISENLEGLTSMLPTLKTGEAIILGEAVKIPMRTMIAAPPKNKRPDSEDPIIFDVVDPEDSRQVGGWGIPMEESPDMSKIIESWRKQSSRVERIEETTTESKLQTDSEKMKAEGKNGND